MDIKNTPGMKDKRMEAWKNCHLSPLLSRRTGSNYFMLLFFFSFPTLQLTSENNYPDFINKVACEENIQIYGKLTCQKKNPDMTKAKVVIKGQVF